jgi:hypothetical protein
VKGRGHASFNDNDGMEELSSHRPLTHMMHVCILCAGMCCKVCKDMMRASILCVGMCCTACKGKACI